jgi:hypothetical protein
MDSDVYLGFFSLNLTAAKDGYMGALLVTDLLGRPAEFRVTLPVKPTAIQRTLYGDALEPYIGVELCGKQLLKALQHELNIMVVNTDYLLQIRSMCSFPVIHIQQAGSAINVQTVADKPSSSERFESLGRFQPVNVCTAPGFDSDLDEARPLVQETLKSLDLLEPFDRIDKALKLLQSQDKKFA